MTEYKAINPAKIPAITLDSGNKIPVVGFGTFGSDHVNADEMAKAVKQAVRLGYRHIDCAAVYNNEKEIGLVFQELYAEGVVSRKELFITSKIWNDHHGPGDVLLSCAQTLKDLQLDYLDLMLIHWPFPNYHPPHCTVDSRNPDAKPYIHEEFMKTYRQLERLQDMGLVRNIGLSNVTIPKLELILRDCRIKPAVNEMELHPHFQQTELYDFVAGNGIANIGYCPLGSPNRPERDKTESDTVDMEDSVVLELADKYGVHPAIICLKWGIQRGHAVIPSSCNPRNMVSNLNVACMKDFTDEEMSKLSQIDKDCRLVKGHVFLWKTAKDWTSLWDMDGEIVNG
jgi:alcohol dehydrogenase (NADP+)